MGIPEKLQVVKMFQNAWMLNKDNVWNMKDKNVEPQSITQRFIRCYMTGHDFSVKYLILNKLILCPPIMNCSITKKMGCYLPWYDIWNLSQTWWAPLPRTCGIPPVRPLSTSRILSANVSYLRSKLHFVLTFSPQVTLTSSNASSTPPQSTATKV